MPLNTVKTILLQAATDKEYRTCFFDQTDALLDRYELTGEERSSLRELAKAPDREDRIADYGAETPMVMSDIRY